MTPQQQAAQLAHEGKCILCRKPDTSLVRGLCRMHHGRFKAWLKRIEPGKREQFEAKLIANGQLLPDRRGRKLDTMHDEFAQAAEEFLADSSRDSAISLADVERIVAEGAEVDERLTASAPAVKREPSLAKRKKSAKKSRQ